MTFRFRHPVNLTRELLRKALEEAPPVRRTRASERQKPECIDRQWDEAGAGVLRDGHQVSWPVKKPSLARQSVFILQSAPHDPSSFTLLRASDAITRPQPRPKQRGSEQDENGGEGRCTRNKEKEKTDRAPLPDPDARSAQPVCNTSVVQTAHDALPLLVRYTPHLRLTPLLSTWAPALR
ncbi:hypothetical protein O3P69_007936 [Scylla paramamosain]|uniref:Uncharacterized protein n=1 Tax=Scylla paramamosain TaxID=85552 RepID=A0AAW0SYX8_SCYPA